MRRLIPTVAAILTVALFTSLGMWQLDRAEEKRELFRAFDQASEDGAEPAPLSLAERADPELRYRWVEGTGRYLDRQFLVDNITRDGRTGYYVLTPFRPEGGGRLLLVNRGWVPAGERRADLPRVPAPDGLADVRGRLDHLPRPGVELGEAPAQEGWPRTLVYPRMEELAQALGEPVADWTVLLDGAAEGGFRRDFRPAVFGPERHLGYAVQWLALAATVVIVWVVLTLRSRTRGEGEDPTEDG